MRHYVTNDETEKDADTSPRADGGPFPDRLAANLRSTIERDDLMIRLGVLGCGDVAFRTYLPGLAALRGRVAVSACTDPIAPRAAQFAEEVGALLGEPCAVYPTLDDMLKAPGLDGVLNLSPAPYHFDTTSKILNAGLNCYSEKPIAGALEEARALMRLADDRGVMLLCAPATMASSRFRWLKEQIESGLIGRPTLITAQQANMGPALWREYKGDPAVFYTEKVGPTLDTGVYPLHGMTGLLGPATSVSAVGASSIRSGSAPSPSDMASGSR